MQTGWSEFSPSLLLFVLFVGDLDCLVSFPLLNNFSKTSSFFIVELQLSRIASALMTLTYNPALHAHLLQLSTSVLLAGETSFWMGSGRHLVEYYWGLNYELSVELCASLSELNWGGWKMIAAPQLIKNTWTALEEAPNKMLKLLANLCKDKKLNDVDAVWRDRMGKWVGQRLTVEDWQRTEGNVRDVCF
jgi:U3 small nucleolar RNA-associated protein 20